jgi:D-alanyl-D-alanine carboxypeptidase
MKKLFITGLLCLSSIGYAQPSQGAWGLYDYNRVEYQQVYNRSEVRSIASITKLFTATTIVRSGLDLDQLVKVQGRSGGRFTRGSMVKRIDLMRAMLISSDNLAAETLALTYPGGMNTFLEDTNRWVKGFGLIDTQIVDASGLLAGNVSTVDELVMFMQRIKDQEIIKSISREQIATLKLPKGKKTITVHLKNTNPIVFHYDNILLSKTGTTNAAGKCVVMLVERAGSVHGVVILGQKNGQERTKISERLIALIPFTRAVAGDEFSKLQIVGLE